MSTKRIFLLLVCVVGISAPALAQVVWQGDDPNEPTLWNVAENWSTGLLPTPEDGQTRFYGSDDFAELVAGDDFTIDVLRLCWGDDDNAHLKINEGAILTTGAVQLAYRVGGHGLIEIDGGTMNTGNFTINRDGDPHGTVLVNSGTLNINGDFNAGNRDGYVGVIGSATLIMNGGTVNVSGNLDSSDLDNPTTLLDLNYGVLNVGGITPEFVDINDLLIDIDYATWIIDGDVTADIAAMETAGELIGFGGTGTIENSYDALTGKTTVTAAHPLNPSPGFGKIVLVGEGSGTTALAWDNIDPNHPGATVTATVWFGTDPNKANPAVYSKVSGWDGQDVTGVTRSSTDPQPILADTTYYWQVDFDNGSGSVIEGDVWEFLVVDNAMPTVAVMNVTTWIDPPNTEGGIAVFPLDATVIDDTPGITYAWTLDPAGDPNVAFDSTTIEDPTLTIDATGVWTVTLTVDDGYWVESASAVVRVSENPCQAARQGNPDFAGNLVADIDGFNGNCVVDLEDFAVLVSEWLEDRALSEFLYY